VGSACSGRKDRGNGCGQHGRCYTRELMKKEFAGTATLRQLLELDDEMLLRVAAA